MAALSGPQVAQILAQAGFKGEQLVQMVGIAKRESNWTPDAHRTNNPKRNDVGDFGLTQINYTHVPTLIANHIITNVQDLLDPVKNAAAAYFLSKNGTNLSPWNATVGVGYDPNGKPLAGVYLNPARDAVAQAQASGLIGKAYASPTAAAPAGAGAPGGLSAASATQAAGAAAQGAAAQGGPKLVPQEERDAFNTYLKAQTPDQQTKIINDLKQNRSLGEVGAYMSQAPPEVNRYINYLGTLDAAGQYGEKSLLQIPDTAGSKQMTDLLSGLGVSYNNAPNPTPALLAFLTGIGLNVQSAADVKSRALERIGTATSDAMADIDRSSARSKQNLTGSLIQAGTLSSGEANTRYAKQAEDTATAQSDVQRSAATQTEAATDAYTQARDLARQQALDRILGAEQDQATQKATSAAQVDSTNAQSQAADAAAASQKAANDAALKAQQDEISRAAQQGVAV